jgi:hypothetical protein
MVSPRSIASPTTVTLQHQTAGGFMANNHLGYHRLVINYFKQGINWVTLSLGKQRITHNHSFDWSVIRELSYRNMLLYVIRVTLFVRWHFVDNMSIVLDWYLSIAILGEIWVIKMRIWG